MTQERRALGNGTAGGAYRELELFNVATNYLCCLSRRRLRVTFGPGDRLLHYVEPFQFIDSAEWYMAQEPAPDGAKISSPQVIANRTRPQSPGVVVGVVVVVRVAFAVPASRNRYAVPRR